MIVSVTYRKRTKRLALKSGATAFDALMEYGINAELVLVKRGNEVIPDAEKLKDRDKLELLRVVTGG